MIFHVGSTNPVKVVAVIDVLQEYLIFHGAEVCGEEVSSGVASHPRSLEETVSGARNRARNVWREGIYGVGIESGMMAVPETITGFMDVCACIIFDGKNQSLGLSSAFEYPPVITKMIMKDMDDANEAFYKSKLTSNNKIGSYEGTVSLLTEGKLNRKEYTKQAIHMALIPFVKQELFFKK